VNKQITGIERGGVRSVNKQGAISVSVSCDAVKEALQTKEHEERKGKNTQKEVEGAKTKKSKFGRGNKLNKEHDAITCE